MEFAAAISRTWRGGCGRLCVFPEVFAVAPARADGLFAEGVELGVVGDAGGCGIPIPNAIAEAVEVAKTKFKIGDRKP